MNPHVQRAHALIRERFRRLRSVDEVAEMVGLAPETFRRQFSRDIGVAPAAFLATQRVEEAKRLLAETDLRAFEVGQAVGWEREDTAAKAFRRAAGLTMLEYRRSVREWDEGDAEAGE